MRRSLSRRLAGAIVAVSVVLTALESRARAEPLRPPPAGAAPSGTSGAGGTIVVTLRGQDGPLFVELYHPKAIPGQEPPFARCRTPCFARLPPGRYKLFVHETEETRAGARTLDLGASSALTIDPDRYGQRWEGLGLAIGGTVAMFAGVVILFSNLCISDGGCGHSSLGDPELGLGLFLGGVVAQPIGWVVFGRSFAPDVDKRPLGSVEHATSREPRPMGLGFKMAF